MARRGGLFTLIFTLILTCPAWSGNKGMVETRVQELKQLNSQLLAQETKIPRDGRLELKAEVHYDANDEPNLTVYSRKFSTIAEEPIRFNGKQAPMPSN